MVSEPKRCGRDGFAGTVLGGTRHVHPNLNVERAMRGMKDAFRILMAVSLLGCPSPWAQDMTAGAEIGQDSIKEKFEHAISAIDGLLGKTHSNRLEVSYVFEEILPKSGAIKDHVALFRTLDSAAIRTHINHKDYIYFSFPYEHLHAFRGGHFVRGDTLVIRYVTSDLSDDAIILSMNAVLVNGDFP
jgi:hypothetical protein